MASIAVLLRPADRLLFAVEFISVDDLPYQDLPDASRTAVRG